MQSSAAASLTVIVAGLIESMVIARLLHPGNPGSLLCSVQHGWPCWVRGAAEHRTGTVDGMVRTLDLAEWAGRWVALDQDDRVQRHAATLSELMAVIDADGVEGLDIMRAPVPGEPVVFGLG